MKEGIRNWITPSLTRNIIAYVILISLVPLIILGAISYWASQTAVHERVRNYTMELMTEKKAFLNLLMSDVENLMVSLASQEDLRQVLLDTAEAKDRNNDFKKLSTQAKIGYILSEYANLEGIISIDLFSTGGLLYHVGETLIAGDIRKSLLDQVLPEVVKSNLSVVWIGLVDSITVNSSFPKVIAAVKVIRALDVETGMDHPIGFLFVSYNPYILHQFIQRKGQTGQIFRIVDQQYRIVCDPDMGNIGKSLDPVLRNNINTQNGIFPAEVNGEKNLVFFERFEDTGWILMSFIQTARIDAQVEVIARNALWATGISLSLAVLFIIYFSHRVVSPITDITTRFKEIQAGRPESELLLKVKSQDEIGELVRWFNTFLNNQAEKRLTEEELVRSQAELKLSYEVLENRIAERTQELIDVNQVLRNEIIERKNSEEQRRTLEGQLRQSQKMEAIGTLAGGIAHDFNNILSAIIGYTELAQMKIEAEAEIQSYLAEVLTAGNRAKDLINQILAFSRHAESEKKPVQIGLIVKEALKLMRASLPSTIEIRENIVNKSLVLCDSTQIHQIVMNICTNAAHAMRDSGGILEVKLTDIELDTALETGYPQIQPGPYLKLTIQDTGQGMTTEVKCRIFDPFFTTKEKSEGTGLGLSVVYGIVRDCGGSIEVYSEADQGTTFVLYFPTIKRKIEVLPTEYRILPTGTEHILCVDDEKPIADILNKMLSLLGYTVEVRTNSLDALELFKSTPDKFDLVITDMTIPHMTGDTLAREMMKIRPDIPVIVCTGFSEKITKETADAMGIKALLMKPLLRDETAQTVRRVLDGVKGSDQG